MLHKKDKQAYRVIPPFIDAGPFGKGCGAGADVEARESFEQPAGAAAAANHISAEWNADR